LAILLVAPDCRRPYQGGEFPSIRCKSRFFPPAGGESKQETYIMSTTPLMPKATAVWLVDNTTMTFDQIAGFCRLHPLEVKAIADGDSAQGIKGLDPVLTGQLSRDEIEKAEADPKRKLTMATPKVRIPETKRRSPRYTPVSKRQDRPNAILWLVRNHAELKDAQVIRLVGTTKPTIEAIRERTHWNSANLTPTDPVTLGLCTQLELDLEVGKAAKSAPKPVEDDGVRLLSAEETTAEVAEPSIGLPDLEPRTDEDKEEGEMDADSVFAKLKSLKSDDL
jgi:hypothetical protein